MCKKCSECNDYCCHLHPSNRPLVFKMDYGKEEEKEEEKEKPYVLYDDDLSWDR